MNASNNKIHQVARATEANSKTPPARKWSVEPTLSSIIAVTALTVLFGIQSVRVLIPDLTWVPGYRYGWGASEMGLVWLSVFLTAFLVGPLQRLLDNRYLIVISASGLGLLRLAIQVWWGEPMVSLALSIAGTVLFLVFLPALLDYSRLRGQAAVSRFILGLLAGLTLDTALHGALSTYDLSWQPGLLPTLLTLLLVMIQWPLSVSMLLPGKPEVSAPAPGAVQHGRFRSLAWLGIGPFLFLQLVVFQNIARLATITTWPLPVAFGWALLAQIAGLAAAAWLLSAGRRPLWLCATGLGVSLTLILALPYPQMAVTAGLLLFLGQLASSLLITIVLVGVSARSGKAGCSGLTPANGAGMLVLAVFVFAYYAVYELNLPYSNHIIEPVAGFLLAICALNVSLPSRQKMEANRRKIWMAPALVLVLLLLPLTGSLAWRAPSAVAGNGFPIRIMTYNLHNGFNVYGRLDMEAIARVIQDSQPDILVLQEVSRGWLVSGRLDMLEWLSQRLGMPYVFGPTAGHFWGNAILSRYPILGFARHDLPPRDLPILRGFTTAVIDIGDDIRLNVIATHLHHLEGDTDIRQLQCETIVDFLPHSPVRTVLMGDLNAAPDSPEMKLLQQAGLTDSAVRKSTVPAYTYPSVNPSQRIDYILVSKELKVKDVMVPSVRASDHLPVIAIIYR